MFTVKANYVLWLKPQKTAFNWMNSTITFNYALLQISKCYIAARSITNLLCSLSTSLAGLQTSGDRLRVWRIQTCKTDVPVPQPHSSSLHALFFAFIAYLCVTRRVTMDDYKAILVAAAKLWNKLFDDVIMSLSTSYWPPIIDSHQLLTATGHWPPATDS